MKETVTGLPAVQISLLLKVRLAMKLTMVTTDC